MKRVLLAAVGAGAIGLGVQGARTRAALPGALKTAIARGLGLSDTAVTLGRVRIGPAGLTIDALSAGSLFVRALRFVPTPAALLGGLDGELRLTGVRLEDPPMLDGLADRAELDRAEIELEGARARVHLHAATLVPARAGWPGARVAELSIELARGRHAPGLRKLAFTGLDLGPLTGLAGFGRADHGALLLDAGAPGVRASLRAEAGSVGGELRLDHARVDTGRGVLTLDGELHAGREAGAPAEADGALRVEEGTLALPGLTPQPLALAGLSIEGGARYAGEAVEAEGTLRAGEARLDATVALRPDEEDTRRLELRTVLPRSDCARLYAALPPALRRTIDGMSIEGAIGGHLELSLPLGAPGELALDGDLDMACRVTGEPPLADATRLVTGAPLLPGAVDAQGAPRRVVLGAENPSFRRLEQLPAAVIDTFVEAEDGRFFRHHGLDLGQLRRALAHDLTVGTPGRGGSTITQQVAKNLFLSGERTLGRKLEEGVLAWRLERVLGKRRILELYLNLVELGPGIDGVEEGAQRWFGKPATALAADEAAQLAALLPAPRRGMDAAFRARLDQLRARLPHAAAPLPLAHALARQP